MANSAFDAINYELDDLTQIYNRKAFYTHTKELLNSRKDISFLICAVNVDRFKVINDLFGTFAGDKLLQYIAEILAEYVDGDPNCLYGRMHADAFLLCVPSTEGKEKEISEFLDKKMAAYPLPLNIYIKCGIYHVHNLGVPVEIMCDRANMAIAQIKGKFSINYNVYDEKLRKQILQEQEINNEMIHALEDGQFTPFYQPKFNMESGKVIGAEALVRWIHPEKGLVSPGIFIPVFERNGFIANLDRYIWERVCIDIQSWIKDDLGICPVSVNVSRAELYDDKLPEVLKNLIEKYQIPIGLLQLEITESAYTDNPEQMINAVERLKDAGFTILMDDFGSGYSSLNTLKDIPIDVLKLDLKFLYNMESNKKADNILKSVVQMAKRLSLSVIAEGVETKNQVDFLKSVGCLKAQGYFYSKPIPRNEYEEILKDKDNVSITDEDFKEGLINVDDIIGRYHREDEVEWYRSAVIMLQVNLFEYDLQRDILTIFDTQMDKESNELQKVEIPNFISDGTIERFTHPDDLDIFINHLNSSEGGTIEFRIRQFVGNDKAYRWYRITDHTIKNDAGEAVSDVGVLLNVSGNYQARAVMSIMSIFAEDIDLSAKLKKSADIMFNNFNIDRIELDFPRRKDASEVAAAAYSLDEGVCEFDGRNYTDEDITAIRDNSDEYGISIDYSKKDTTEGIYISNIADDYTCIVRLIYNCENRGFAESDRRQMSEVCRCIIKNIDGYIRERRDRQNVEMYANAFRSSRVMLREWDIATKTLTRSDAYADLDGRGRVLYNVPELPIEDGYVHPDFIDEYRKVFENLAKGQDQVLMAKVKGASGCYEWMWVDYRVIFSDEGVPLKAIGTGEDINTIFLDQQNMRRRLKLEKHIIPDVISWIHIDITEDRVIDASGDMSEHTINSKKYSELCRHIATEHVVESDQEEYIKRFSVENMKKSIIDGQQIAHFRYRMKHDDGTYQWRETDADLYQSRKDGHFKAFAYVRDVGQHMKWQEYTSLPVERDGSLHIYEKDYFENLIDSIMANEDCDNSALILLDMDRFGILKENFGQRYANEIIRNIVTIIRATIRPGMIIGRIYEDRFAIFVKEKKSMQEIFKLTSALEKRIFNAFHAGDKDYILSVSVGLGYVDELAEKSFEALYNEAEAILLDAKNSIN